MTVGPLNGIRVLDLAPLLPGAFATMWLGDLGADVIKVEAPGGDLSRWLGDGDDDRGPYFDAVNRNKRSVVLDLKTSRGQEALHKLAATADILVEGFRPGVVERLGASYEVLSAGNPRLIYCSITGFGQTGPQRAMPGHDLTYLALTGILACNHCGVGPPHPLPVQLADIGGGTMPALTAVLAALYHRERSGLGQYVDVSMVDGSLSWLAFLLPLSRRPDLQEMGVDMLTGGALSYNVYETADGRYLAVAALEAHFWTAICEAMGRPDLVAYGLNPEPGAAERLAEVRAIFRSRTLDQWLELLDVRSTPCAPVLTVDEAVSSPAIVARGLVGGDGTPQIAFPARLRSTPASIRRPPPHLGEHTAEVLQEVGLTVV